MLVLGAAPTLLLTLSACGRQTVIRTTDTLDQAEPEASAADTLIRLPELALSGLGFTFDTPRELTAEFSFADGSTVSLVWFFTDGGLVYNEEFSRLPGEASASGTD